MAQVRQCAGCLPLLLVTDGFAAYATALRKVFRDPVERTGRGRRRLQTWAGLCDAQVIKRYEQRRVVAVERRVKYGAAEQVEGLRHKAGDSGGVLNTAFIERLNATFRGRLTALVRRTRTLARRTATIEHGMWLVGTLYNFCTPHESLRVRGGENRSRRHAPRRWRQASLSIVGVSKNCCGIACRHHVGDRPASVGGCRRR